MRSIAPIFVHPTSAIDAVDGSHHRHRNVPKCCSPCGNQRVCSWLDSEVQSSEIEVCSSLNSGHSVVHSGLPFVTQAENAGAIIPH